MPTGLYDFAQPTVFLGQLRLTFNSYAVCLTIKLIDLDQLLFICLSI